MNIKLINNTGVLWENLHRQDRFRPKYPSEVVVQFVLRTFKRNSENKVLDLGCGAGRHIFFMVNENIDTYGIDVSREGISYTNRLLNEYNLKANLEVSSVEKIPYVDNYFDGIICYGVLYYCDSSEIKNAVKEIYRVLKPCGKALIVVRNTKDYRYGNGKEIEKNTFLIEENNLHKCSFNENGMKMHFFTLEEINELFQEFSCVTVEEIIETHENRKYMDSNYIIFLEK